MTGKASKRNKKRMMENPVYPCSGTSEHAEGCDGSDNPLTETEILINEEMLAWQRAGINPSQINYHVYQINAQLRTLIAYLVEEDIVDRTKLDQRYREILLEELSNARRMIEPVVRQQRLRPNGIIGPDGKPFMP